jgi:hypothetical protein
MIKKNISILSIGVFLIVGLLSYQFIIVPVMASIKKATIEKYSDCIIEGLRERVMKNKIIKWIGSTDDQFEDIKVCDECRKKLGIPEAREWFEIGDKVRHDYYNR